MTNEPEPHGPRIRATSVGTKLGLAVAAVVILIGFFAAQTLAQRERANLVMAKQLGAERVVRLFILSVYPALDFDDDVAVQESLDHLMRDDEVLAAYVWGLEGSEPTATFERIDAELSAPERPTVTDGVEFEVHDDRLIARAPILADSGERLGDTLITWSLAREQAAIAEALRLIVAGASVTVFGVIGLIFTATRLIVVRPLTHLEHAAGALGRGEDIAISLGSRDEIGRLARVFAQMAEAIGDRERRLRAAHNEIAALFDNMRQAIVSVGPDRRIVGRSSLAARQLLGSIELEGEDLCTVLLAGIDEDEPDRIAFELWLETALGAREAAWPEIAALAPEELSLPRADGREVDLRLEFRPVFEHGKVARIMLLATDESDKRRLEREAKARQSAHEIEMQAMRRIVASGTLPFAAFLRSSATRLDRVIELGAAITSANHQEMYRHVHTIKGEARTFGLVELEAAAATLEDTLERIRPPRPTSSQLASELQIHLAAASAALASARQRLVEASPIGDQVLDQITVSNQDLIEVRRLTDGLAPSLRAAVDRLAARPFGECVAGLADAAPTWAAAHAKRVRIEVVGGAIRVPASLAEVLRGCVTHLVRNAVAHGIETSAVRESIGKPAVGTVTLEARSLGAEVEIRVHDDGAGLPTHTQEQAHGSEWVFEHGTTTQAVIDELAGRGVGLAAVRRELAGVGFQIEISQTDASGTCFSLRRAT